jgi:hypothetical protein
MHTANDLKIMMNVFRVARHDLCDIAVCDTDPLFTGFDRYDRVFVNLPLTITHHPYASDRLEIETLSVVIVQDRNFIGFKIIANYRFQALLRRSLVGEFPYNDLSNLAKLFTGQSIKQHLRMSVKSSAGEREYRDDPDSWIEVTLNRGKPATSMPFDMSEKETSQKKKKKKTGWGIALRAVGVVAAVTAGTVVGCYVINRRLHEG